MLNTALIYGGIAAAVLYAISSANSASNAAKDIRSYVTMPTGFRISGGMVQLDVEVQVHNFHNAAIRVDNLVVSAERESNGQWIEFAASQPNLSNIVIQPNNATKIPVQLQTSLFGALVDLFQIGTNYGNNKIRVNAAPTVMGVRMAPVSKIYTV